MKRVVILGLVLMLSAGASDESDRLRTAGEVAIVAVFEKGGTSVRPLIARDVVRSGVGSLHATDQSPQPNPPVATKRSWAERHPVALGALVGLGLGVAVGQASVRGDANTLFLWTVGGGIGAAVGGLIGGAIAER